ncbi:hypothetical protein AB0A69_07795 [Streptomyces sp. NPDC045431]|uniref:hypothetical protein n=1 Tax=Streptomyces sp. NPDC045431 TaxID=3155613 RepID=UPI0033C6B73A
MTVALTAAGSDVYAAVVTHTVDPEGRGRVRLRIPQVSGDAITDWAYPSGAIGHKVVVGERVWATFDGSGSRLVYWIATSADDQSEFDVIEPLQTWQTAGPDLTQPANVWNQFPESVWPTITFTAPNSGKAFITISGRIYNNTGATSSTLGTAACLLGWDVYDSVLATSDGISSNIKALSAAGGQLNSQGDSGGSRLSSSRRTLVEGLIPGRTYNVRPVWFVTSPIDASKIYMQDGQLLVEPVARTAHPPACTYQNIVPQYVANDTWTDYDPAVWAPITFTVPPSGKAYISVSGMCSNSANETASVAWMGYRLTGAYTTDSNTQGEFLALSSSGEYHRVFATRRVLFEDLPPGQRVTVVPQWRVSATEVTNVGLRAGQLIVEPIGETSAPYVPTSTKQIADPPFDVVAVTAPFTEAAWPSLTFIAGASGKAFVTVSAAVSNDNSPAATSACSWTLVGPSDDVSTARKEVAAAGTNRRVHACRRVLLDDLKPGAQYTLVPTWRVSSVTQTGGVFNAKVRGGQLSVEPVPPATQQATTPVARQLIVPQAQNDAWRAAIPPEDGTLILKRRGQAGYLEVATGGTWVPINERHYAHCEVNNLGALTGGAYKAVPFTSCAVQTDDSMWLTTLPSRITIRTAGLYRITANCTWPGSQTDARAAIGVNSLTSPKYQLDLVSQANGLVGSSGTRIAYLGVSDYVAFLLYSTATTASFSTTACALSVEWIGP